MNIVYIILATLSLNHIFYNMSMVAIKSEANDFPWYTVILFYLFSILIGFMIILTGIGNLLGILLRKGAV